ncbi:DUF6252 family protein [Cochleicola gelatinilyticus]|uniref:Lipoprotein n=1 Tax=Cochleicola gelatinilyticus TaxID=1763537 RepID=A0A167EYR0_9FLAO|nr:DUF6252 family protein [Cochleicola gelatinilyticus]OAB76016.1 hypothetical protein ULVI_13200 [Cochleicola gelatinilyticus]
MKHLKTIGLVLFISLAFASCKSDDDGGDDGNAGNGTLEAQVDGQNYTSIPEASRAELNTSSSVQTLAVTGGTLDSENIQMIIIGFEGEGTYQLNLTNIGTYSYLPDPGNPDPNSVVVYTTVGEGQASNGEVSISSFDGNRVLGTFSFTGYNLDDTSDTVAVTNGSFNMQVVEQ